MIDSYFTESLFILTPDEVKRLFGSVEHLASTDIKIFEVNSVVSNDQIRCAIFGAKSLKFIVVNSLDERIHSFPKRSTSNLKLVSIADVVPRWCNDKYYFGPVGNFIFQLQQMDEKKLKALFVDANNHLPV